jgi:membrane protein implicated in regulation of membrane protease activity
MPAWLIWLIICGGLAAAEATNFALVLIMAAAGAGAASIVAAVGAPVVVQVLVAIAGTLALLWGVRPVAIRHLNPDPMTVTGTDALVGQEAIVMAKVDRHDGRVRLNGAEWSARTMDPKQEFSAGTVVAVVAIDGATAVVWKDPFS